MKHPFLCAFCAVMLLNSVQGVEKSSAASFVPPLQQENKEEMEENAKPFPDIQHSTFVFGRKRIVFSGPGNFTCFDGERKIMEQYMTFSSPYKNWLSTRNLKTEIAEKYDGGPVCITRRDFDAKTGTFTIEGIFPGHPADSPASQYKLFRWSQTAKLLPDGKLEIIFVNHADDA